METTTQTEFHFLVLGDCAVGKTTLTTHFINDAALGATEPTLVYDLAIRELSDARYGLLKFVVWDAAGDERFHGNQSTMQLYYRHKNAIIVLFDMTRRDSFVNVQRLWLPRIRTAAPTYDTHGWRLCLVANKLDRAAERQVTTLEAQELAHNNSMDYMELSSLCGSYDQMRQPFLTLAVQLIEEGIVKPMPRAQPVSLGPQENRLCCTSS